MTVPGNILRFEIALYLSLMLDTLSTAVQAMTSDASDQATYGAANIINVLFILAFVFLVGYAARKRKNWARLTLLAALVLAVISLFATLTNDSVELSSVIDVVSVGLTIYGLYCSFTGDAKGWFTG